MTYTKFAKHPISVCFLALFLSACGMGKTDNSPTTATPQVNSNQSSNDYSENSINRKKNIANYQALTNQLTKPNTAQNQGKDKQDQNKQDKDTKDKDKKDTNTNTGSTNANTGNANVNTGKPNANANANSLSGGLSGATTGTQNPNTGTIGSGNQTPSNNTNIQGRLITIDSNDIIQNIDATNDTSDKYILVIDGRKLDFSPSKSGISASPSGLTHVGNDGQFAYTRYGYLQETRGGVAHLYVQGEVTSDMPTTGQATYQGHAVQLGKGRPDERASATFNVDYGKKTIAGDITASNGTTKLEGTIKGNGFSGEKNGVQTQGYFYGDNAKELGGTYRNQEGTVSGAYAAKK